MNLLDIPQTLQAIYMIVHSRGELPTQLVKNTQVLILSILLDFPVIGCGGLSLLCWLLRLDLIWYQV